LFTPQVPGGFTNVSQKYRKNSNSFGNFNMNYGYSAGINLSNNLVPNTGNNSSKLSIDASFRLIF